MENQLQNIVNLAQTHSPYNVETKSELEQILKDNGGTHFKTLGNIMFTVNEYDILEGIGFSWMGDFKIWNNTKFGTFKKDDSETVEQREFLGKTLEEAMVICKETNRVCRVTMEDGVGRMVTMDWRVDRINFHVEKGIITKVSKG